MTSNSSTTVSVARTSTEIQSGGSNGHMRGQLAAWKAATRFALAKCTPDQMVILQEINSPEAASATLLKAQLQKKSKRSAAVLEKVRLVLDGVKVFEDAMKVYSNAGVIELCLLWGSLTLLIQMASRAVSCFDRFLDVTRYFTENLERTRRYAENFRDDERMQHVLIDLYCDFVDFCVLSISFFRQKGITMLWRVLWPKFERKLGSIDTQMRSHQVRVDSEASAAAMVRTRAAELDAKEHRRMCQYRDAITWLEPTDVQIDYERYKIQRLEGLGDWLFQQTCVKRWRAGDFNILWINGIPGCGKTMLMSAFIDQILEADSSSDTAKCTVFFFFDATSAVRNYPGALLRSLCAQILAHNPEMADVVYEIVVKSGQPRATSMTYLFRTLRSLLDTDKNLDTITFVIDALDECNDLEESGVLDFLLELVGNGSPKLRLLLSSRAEPGLRDKLKSYQKLSVTPEKTYADIEMYIRTSLKNSNMAAFQEGRLLSRITERLMSNANGQFIWVRLILDELRKAAFVREIDDILDNLPAGLEKAYLRIFHRLSKEPRRRQQAARDIFYWLSCAERPLSLRELEYALALRLGDQKLEPVAQMLNLESLLNEVCGSLVEIVGSDKTMVRFVHVTIKQFLVAPLGTWETDNKALLQFHVDAQAAHAYLATTCLTQLHFPEVEGISTFQNRDGIQSKCQLLSYASMFWATHLSRSGQPTHELLRQVSNFLTSKNMEAYLGWYSQQKTTAQSITLLQSHLTAWISQLPSGDPRVNSTVNLFQKHFEKTAQSRAEEFGWNSPEHLESIHQLATLLHSAGAWEAAEKSARQCAEAREQIFGIEHPSTMESQFQLGSLLRRLGRVSEAVKLHTTVVEGRRRTLGIYHPDTLDSEDELATTTNGGKTFDHIVQAEQMSRDTLLRKIRQYGEEHERTAATKNILASTLKDKALVLRTLGQEILAAGTLEECVELCHACMQVRRIAFGDDHPEVITTWNMLGIVMQLLGRLEESEEWHQKTFRARQKIFGPHNPHTQRSMRNLVNTYAAQFEKEKSDKMKQRLMTSLQKNPVLLRRTSWERFKLDIEKGYLTGY